MTPDLLSQYAEAMKRGGVLRVSGEEAENATDFTIELHPSVFGAGLAQTPGDTAAALEAAYEAEKCACGHDRVAEHHNGLCIAGACDPALCSPGAKLEGA